MAYKYLHIVGIIHIVGINAIVEQALKGIAKCIELTARYSAT